MHIVITLSQKRIDRAGFNIGSNTAGFCFQCRRKRSYSRPHNDVTCTNLSHGLNHLQQQLSIFAARRFYFGVTFPEILYP